MTKRPELPIILTDLDGVVVDTVQEVLVFLHDALDAAVCQQDITEYNIGVALSEGLGLPAKTINEMLTGLFRAGDVFARARPYFDVLQAYIAFINAGGTIIPITSRPPGKRVCDATMNWLELWMPKAKQPVFTKDKASAVHEHMKHSSGEVWFVDDCPTVCFDVYRHISNLMDAAGEPFEDRLKIYMPLRPWTDGRYRAQDGVPIRYIIQDIEELLK